MTTKKPRITITLEPRTYELLKAIQDGGGQSMSSFISELLQQNEVVLERMATAFQKIKKVNDQRKSQLAETLAQIHTDLEPMLQEMIGQFDLFMGRVEEASGVEQSPTAGRDVPASARPADGDSAASAPLTNRGVTKKTSRPKTQGRTTV